MVEDGWAFAFVRYSRDYVALEDKARRENIGMHPSAVTSRGSGGRERIRA